MAPASHQDGFRTALQSRTPQVATLLGVALLAAITLAGTVGFVLLEDWTFLDAFFMTVITLSTVGYQEIHPLSAPGKIFASILIMGGLATAAYTFAQVGQALIADRLAAALGKRRMKRSIDRLDKHFIICGYGRLGNAAATALHEEGHPLCVVDLDPKREEILASQGYPHLTGDATDEALLEEAGISRAKTLLALLPTDADNLYLTMAAKELNPAVRVVARAEDERAERRLKRSGADTVISPYRIAGYRVLQAALNPTVVEVMEVMTHTDFPDISLGEAKIDSDSPIANQTIAQADIRNRYGLIVMAIKHADGERVFNPAATNRVKEGDILVVIGNQSELIRFKADCE